MSRVERYLVPVLGAALIGLLIVEIFRIGYRAGYVDGDSAARSERAETINQCYDRTATKIALYGCYSAN